MARLYQKINNEAVPLGGGGGGSVAIDNDTITKNSDDEIQVATALTGKINQLNNSAADMGKVLTANGDGTAEWDNVLVPIDYETITKNGNGELQVSSVPYDNTTSGLTADNVQDAIDEVDANFGSIQFRVTVSGNAEWKERGADTWHPFNSGGGSKGIYLAIGYNATYAGCEITILNSSDNTEIVKTNTDASSSSIDIYIDYNELTVLPTYFIIKNSIDTKEVLVRTSIYGWYEVNISDEMPMLIPKLTGNSSAIVVSSVYASYPAWQAFDRNDSTFFSSESNNNAYIGYNFGSSKIIKKVRIKPAYDGGNARMKAYTVQGLSGSSWVNIASGTAPNSGNAIIHYISGLNSYSGVRLNITSQYNSGYIRVCELQAYGY